jgi:hypothetical protein
MARAQRTRAKPMAYCVQNCGGIHVGVLSQPASASSRFSSSVDNIPNMEPIQIRRKSSVFEAQKGGARSSLVL